VKRILVIDDEQDHAYVFALILEDHGFIVDTFTDPTMALSEFRLDYYDLIILDYYMENINGLDLCKKIKSLDRSPKTLLVTAGYEQLQLQMSEIKKNFVLVLKKPISGSRLLKEVCTILNQTYVIPNDENNM
jgi:CheY-like chemotaxis protein